MAQQGPQDTDAVQGEQIAGSPLGRRPRRMATASPPVRPPARTDPDGNVRTMGRQQIRPRPSDRLQGPNLCLSTRQRRDHGIEHREPFRRHPEAVTGAGDKPLLFQLGDAPPIEGASGQAGEAG